MMEVPFLLKRPVLLSRFYLYPPSQSYLGKVFPNMAGCICRPILGTIETYSYKEKEAMSRRFVVVFSAKQQARVSVRNDKRCQKY